MPLYRTVLCGVCQYSTNVKSIELPENVPQGKYTLTVEMDGYQTFTKAVSLGSTKQDIPVAMKKAKAEE